MKSKIIITLGIFSAAFMLILFTLSGCSSNNSGTNPTYGGGSNSGSGGPGANEVWMQSIAFNPSMKTVMAGTTITWTNKDGTSHTVTSGTRGNPDGLFDSGNINSNGTFSHTFSTKGTFQYYCQFHSNMNGTIVVQ